MQALERAGYTKDNMPYVTGMDATLPALRDIVKGLRGSTVYRDPALLHQALLNMVNAIVKGEEVETNNVAYDGDNEIPAYYCEPKLIRSNDIDTVFVKGEIYPREEIYR